MLKTDCLRKPLWLDEAMAVFVHFHDSCCVKGSNMPHSIHRAQARIPVLLLSLGRTGGHLPLSSNKLIPKHIRLARPKVIILEMSVMSSLPVAHFRVRRKCPGSGRGSFGTGRPRGNKIHDDLPISFSLHPVSRKRKTTLSITQCWKYLSERTKVCGP